MGDSDLTVFANKVIDQVIGQTVGDKLLMNPQDFMAIRIAFRSSGGSWAELGIGNRKHIELLKDVVKAWGQMPGRKTKDELV